MTLFRADLHVHSTCSDGTLSPVELVDRAAALGLQGLSITDHDTCSAYESALPRAQERGLRLGTGVEFSCQFKGESIHLLGYDYRLDDASLHAFCALHQQRRTVRNRAILDKLARLSLPVDESELGGGTVGRPHIAQAMVKRGYVGTVRTAFSYYLGDGKRAHVPSAAFSIEEAIEVIHRAGGKAFLAHPHLIRSGQLVREILALPFDGIECYYGRCSLDREKRWLKIAREKELLISGGSDFHGAIKPDTPLGCSWVDQQTFNLIFA